MGGSIKAHLDQRRARRRHLLAYSDTSINDIAHILAFPEVSAFSRFYKRLTGQSPRKARADTK